MSATAAATSSQAMNTLNVVSSQIQNLLNVHVTRYINTGDRIVDNGATIILHSCIALIGAYIYTAIINISMYVYNYWIMGRPYETDDPTDIDYGRFDYSKWVTDDIKKYPHIVTINCSTGNLDKWITDKNIEINSLKPPLYMGNPDGTILRLGISGEAGYFMPLWKYKNAHKETKYVWIIGSALYSESFKELEACYCAIIKNGKSGAANTNETIRRIYTPPNNGGSTLLHVGEVDKHKTFNNIYYDQKQTLIDLLDKFKTGAMYPNNICTNKCGILLYGPPGTGKTGTISAIANYLQRDIIMVHDLTSETLKELNKQLDSLSGRRKYIIVFDEFDHILCDNRDETAQFVKEMKLAKLREALRDESNEDERKSIQAEIKTLKESKSDAAGLGELLRFLDGMADQTDRFIIATTNQPYKINKRLLRPGRFDLKLELGYCSMQMFCDIIHNIFPDDIARLDELTYTQTLGVGTEATAALKASTIELVQTTTMPMKTYIDRLLEKCITPLNLINTGLTVKTFDALIEALNVLEPDTFIYTK